MHIRHSIGDLAQLRAVVQARLDEHRSFNADSELAVQAQRVAEQIAAGSATELVVDQTIIDLRRIRSSSREVKIHLWNGPDIADFQPPPAILGRELSYIGIGVARGPAAADVHRLDFYVALVLGVPPDRVER